MKKIKLTGKLVLNKETIARLNNKQMGAIHGGGSFDDGICADTQQADCTGNSVVANCQDTFVAGCTGNPSIDARCVNSNGLTCCNGSWNQSSCGGSPCGGSGTANTQGEGPNQHCCL